MVCELVVSAALLLMVIIWLFVVGCLIIDCKKLGKIAPCLNKPQLVIRDNKRRDIMNRFATIMIFIIIACCFVGCNSTVLKLRAISNNAFERKMSDTVKDILFYAEQAAIRRECYTMKRFMATEPEVQYIVKEIKEVDRKFKVEVKENDSFTDVIVRW